MGNMEPKKGARRGYLVLMAALFFYVLMPLRLQAAPAPAAPAPDLETVILKVYLNTVEKGDSFILLTKEGVVLMPAGDLKEIGILRLPEGSEIEVEGTKYIPLDDLAPGITYELDEKKAELRITAAPGLLEKTVIDLSPKRDYDVTFTSANSAFLNYSVTYSADNDFNLTSLNVPLELGLSIGGVLGLSTFSYTRTTTDDTFVRLMTNITVDEPGRQRRYMAGDITTPIGVLGGLSVSKNFTLTPFFVTSPTLTLQGVAETPSDVFVYVDDRLIDTEHLPAGEFAFTNIRDASNRGESRIVIKDAFGRETEIVRPYYISTTFLKKGLQEYSLDLGFRREAIGTEDFNYGSMAFTGSYGLGVTDNLTARARLDVENEIVSLMTDAGFTLGRFGVLDTQAAGRYGRSRTGYSALFSYSYGSKGIGGGFSASYFSRDFATIGVESPALVDNPRVNASVNLTYNHVLLGSISGSFSIIDKWSGTDTREAALHYSRRLIHNATLFARASRTWSDTTSDFAFVGINYSLGHEISGGLSYSAQDSHSTESAYITRNAPAGEGVGLRAFVDRTDGGSGAASLGGGGAGTYRGRYGVYTFDYRRTSGVNSYTLTASGGVALINSAIYFSRPINDSYALVRVGGLQGVKVRASNQVSGTTNKKGELFVTGLTSYYDNPVSIDSADIPVNYELREVRKYISMPFRGGAIVDFKARKLQAFMGSFFIVQNGVKKPAEYWGFSLEAGDMKVRVVVGRGGEFYLENIPSGTWPARLFQKGRECRFKMTIPESDDMMVEMEEVVCEMD